ncbi:MAG: TolC family protein, partial [Spirochaetota bacterium]|nr:TolC family protein [Spirochaetota bacterium]
EVFTLYYSVFNLKIIVQIRKEEYLKAVEFYKLTENRLKHKKVLPFDLLLSKGLMIQTKNNWVKATYDYIEEKLNLMHKLNLREDIELIEEHAPTKPNSLKESIELSLSQRPDIKEKYYDIKVKNELYEIERSVFYPKVSLFSDLRLSSFNDVSLNERKEWSIFLTVSLALMDDVSVSTSGGYKRDYLMTNPKDSESVKLSLFDGSSNIVNKEKAKSNLKLTQLEMKDLEYKISREIISSYHSFLKAKDDITLAKLNLKIGEGLVKKADAEYKLGKKGMEDIIEAKEKEILYKIEYQQINLKYKLAILSLKWAMGNLWKDFF